MTACSCHLDVRTADSPHIECLYQERACCPALQAAHLYLTDAPRLAQLMEAALKAAEELQPQAGKKA
jgi:hypothetical protein